jgi:hypothetical protein
MKTLINMLFVLMLSVTTISTVSAQTPKQAKEAKKAAEIKELIDSKNYVFQATYMYPTGGGQRYLTSPYEVTVSRDTIVSYLPFFGVAYSGVGYSPDDNGIKFTSTKFDYQTQSLKNGGYRIFIKPKDTNNATQMQLTVFANGNADLSVVSANRQRIRFDGYIRERNKTKA